MTEAHKTLPLPCAVWVTNLQNGLWSDVRVNDRGSFTLGCVIDVSRRAAQELGFEKQGLILCRIEVLSGGDGAYFRKANR